MFKKLFVISILIVIVKMAAGQALPPGLRCLAVNPDGSVTLNWIKPPDGNGFQTYEIYYSDDTGGPFILAGSVNDFDTETFTHTGINAQDESLFYYVISQYTSGQSDPSETLRTMLLLLLSPDPETAQLAWNNILTPPLPSSGQWFRIYMEYPAGIWTLIDSTQENSYTAKFFDCNDPEDIVNFRVELPDASGCNSISSLAGELLYNFTKPEIPVMDSVSITPSGEVIIGWQPTPTQDTRGYIIYLVTSTNDSIDYVDGIGNTSYVHSAVDPCQFSYTYAIAAIDSCGNKSGGTFNIPQRTLIIESIEYDACLLSNTITWNGYINFDPEVGRYELFVSENGGPETVLATLGSGQTSYLHEDLSPNTTYEYYVRAISQDDQKSSTSCPKSITTYDSPRPDFLYLRQATVVDNDHVDLLFYTDTSAFVNLYRILRSESDAGPFEEVGTVLPSIEENLAFSDMNADVNTRSYYYKVTVIDTCNIESEIANSGRTIFLSVNANEDRTNLLQWNAYESWDAGVDSYEIYRLINSVADPAGPLAILSSSTFSYVDDVSDLNGTNSVVEYYVRAIEGDNNSFGFRDDALSNIARALQESKVFIPNAFSPGGINRTFKPVSSFISPDDYLFSIYDRFGREIFSTTSPTEGWDGRIDGREVPQGVYVYLLRFRDTFQRTVSRTGTVMVLY